MTLTEKKPVAIPHLTKENGAFLNKMKKSFGEYRQKEPSQSCLTIIFELYKVVTLLIEKDMN